MSNTTTPQDFLNQIASAMPQIKTNKNGYEIRAQVLELANQSVWNDYYARLGQYETSITREGSEVVTSVKMPEVPGVSDVLEAAEKFYGFINNK